MTMGAIKTFDRIKVYKKQEPEKGENDDEDKYI